MIIVKEFLKNGAFYIAVSRHMDIYLAFEVKARTVYNYQVEFEETNVVVSGNHMPIMDLHNPDLWMVYPVTGPDVEPNIENYLGMQSLAVEMNDPGWYNELRIRLQHLGYEAPVR